MPSGVDAGPVFHGYETGAFWSRKLERMDGDSFAFTHIAAGAHPEHDTIAAFRRGFLKELPDPFLQILKVARAAGFSRVGTVGFDDTKIQANASRPEASIRARALSPESG